MADESANIDGDIDQDDEEQQTPGQDRPADSGPHDPASEPVRLEPADSGPHDPASVPAGGDSPDDPAATTGT